MAKTSIKKVREGIVVRDYSCPTCAAKQHEWCTVVHGPGRGEVTKDLHIARWSRYLNDPSREEPRGAETCPDTASVFIRKDPLPVKRERFEWLVELHDCDAILYHVIVVASSVELAVNLAEREYSMRTANAKLGLPPELNYFRFEASELGEIVQDYFWYVGEDTEALEVRRLREVAEYVPAGVVK